MTLGQALLYFLREASVSLVRSWKVSLLAIFTIAVSLFLGGMVLLIRGNLLGLVEHWRGQVKVIVYLEDGIAGTRLEELSRIVAQPRWVSTVEEVTPAAARERFSQTFPSLADLMDGWNEEPLPPSLEVGLDPEKIQPETFAAWIAAVGDQEDVSMVDDDRDWLARLETLIALIEGIGLVLVVVLLGAAIFTIASVVRLTAYLYREEIAIMRLVGATEFFIRGPFYVEGLLQGLGGGLVAVTSLFAAHSLMDPAAPQSMWLRGLFAEFLPWTAVVALIALGAVAGLTGAIASLRRESLGQETVSAAG